MSNALAVRGSNVVSQTTLAVFPASKPGEQPVQAIVKVSPNGAIRNALTQVRLTKENGEVWSLRQYDYATRQYVEKKSITAAGYHKLNVFMGVTFYQPEKIVAEDGTFTSNPHFHRNASGEIIYVKVRCIGLGRNAIGNLVAQDLTLNYNLSTYFAQDIFSRWTGKKDEATKDWGKLVPAALAKPTPDELPIPIAGGAVLLVKLSHRDVFLAIGEHLNRQKFAERNAITICQRNILKRFVGAQVLSDSGVVPVVGWVQPDRDFVEVGKKIAEANDGRIIVDDQPIEVERVQESVETKEDADEALGGEYDEESPPFIDGEVEDDSAASAPVSAGVTAAETAQLISRCRDAAANLDPQLLDDCLVACDFSTWGAVNGCKDAAKLNALLAKLQAAAKPKAAAPTQKQAQAPKPQPKPDQQPSEGKLFPNAHRNRD